MDYRDTFQEDYNDDGQLELSSKKTFFHDEERENGTSFHYRYAVSAVDVYKAARDENAAYVRINAYLVPDACDWCEKSLKDAAKAYGLENKPIMQIRNQLHPRDAITEGYGIPVLQEDICYSLEEYPEGLYDVTGCPEISQALDRIADELLNYWDGMRGFILDRPKNGIGTTGWDVINEALYGKDAILTSIRRITGERG